MSGLEVLSSIEVGEAPRRRSIELCKGDLTRLSTDDAVDILVISAFPDDYTETPTSLIGALAGRCGISVTRLAQDKELDLRASHSCWLSRELAEDVGFKRILCFEPSYRGSAPEVVEDIFVSLNSILLGSLPESTVAMPLVASGDQGWDEDAILRPLLEAGVHWLRIGLPLQKLKIVERSESKAQRLVGIFTSFQSEWGTEIPAAPAPSNAGRNDRGEETEPAEAFSDYDVFVSYAREDAQYMEGFVRVLREARSNVRIFVDTEQRTGADWIETLASALDTCRVVVPMYTQNYFDSKWCKQELNVAVIREREGLSDLLFPIYLFSADNIASFYLTWNYADCREGNDEKLRATSEALVARLG